MRNETGGEAERLAPVIPLFGAGTNAAPRSMGPRFVADEPADAAAAAPERAGARTAAFGALRDTTGGDASVDESDVDPAERVAAAERALLRKLAARSLSWSEARTVLASAGVTAEERDDILERAERVGYLDDAELAQQVVRSAVERKGQGRHAIAQTLAKRGIPRPVADAALAELVDDDAERALDYARTKVRRTTVVDREAALRRLVGQLSRRGYPSSVAMTAARTALDETGGVRFD